MKIISGSNDIKKYISAPPEVYTASIAIKHVVAKGQKKELLQRKAKGALNNRLLN